MRKVFAMTCSIAISAVGIIPETIYLTHPIRITLMELMLDIETLGTGNNAIISSIGAVRFEFGKIQTPAEIGQHHFDYHLDIQEQQNRGRRFDLDTFMWWMEQSEAAKAGFLTGRKETFSVGVALNAFGMFCNGSTNIWGNGNTFDNVILKSLYDAFNMPYPVKYSGDMDFRTLKYMAKKRFPEWEIPYPIYEGMTDQVAHIAWIDAARHASSAQLIYAKLAS